ncbi:alpha-isopropylmalate synthase regulatory domain-containing protein [Kutzneria sp. 744]|uniref:alpha-isopropylmalate synthase regulatory domain-containing protein n=1 Tax=Kutzneria sp. (strain 744) TaxID=345341 RepID=UPI0003EED75C|nr:alpha-isopropylmalate synthase regulatory domain-containing protein [Kutzneria sp. 744]EWM11936.1 2-isopropylmalate synthase [Kutzneria sp. 744]
MSRGCAGRQIPQGTPLGDDFHLYDTTLVDGARREGVAYSVKDRLEVARLLDNLGVGYIEGGRPGATPQDIEFFRRAGSGELELRHAALVAAGTVGEPGRKAEDDPQVRALLDAQTPVVTLAVPADRRHIERVQGIDVAEQAEAVGDTVRFLTSEGRRVFLAAQHFFDGYEHDRDAALRVLTAGVEAGADVAVLCDTNGGQLPGWLSEIVQEVVFRTGFRIGVHCRDDAGCAVANTIAAVQAGAMHVRCAANGYGERVGNPDLFTVIGNLATKLELPVLPQGGLAELTRTSQAVAEIANVGPEIHRPYVGSAAFTAPTTVDPTMHSHVDPAAFGNTARTLVAATVGRVSIELKAAEYGLDLPVSPEVLDRVASRIKDMEAGGWSFEAADASLELLLRKEVGENVAPYDALSYRVLLARRPDGSVGSEATVLLAIGGAEAHGSADGSGPVEALDAALRQALAPHLAWLGDVQLVDYKVRTLTAGAEAVTRVSITSRDAGGEWTTVGTHPSVVEASMLALTDALAYKQLREREVIIVGGW